MYALFMKFFYYKVFFIFLASVFMAGILWFFIINQAIVDTFIPIAFPEISADISVYKMVLHIDDVIIYADQILGDRASKNIRLVGNAKLYWKEFEFIGTHFQYLKNEDHIITLNPITINMPHIIMTADCMKINTKQQIIELNGSIHTIFDKK